MELKQVWDCGPATQAGLQSLQNDLHELQARDRMRELRCSEILPDGRIRIGGQELLNLCSNDYLGIVGEIATPPLNTGSGGSRLVCGNSPELTRLEQLLCDLHGSEASLVFGSGYLANLGVISALAGRGDAVFSDKLNHASIVDGCELSRADHYRYRHCDLDHLEHLLKEHDQRRRKLIVSDAVFSMDGDRAPIEALVELKERYNAFLMVDEAHSGGVMGPRGAGLAAEHGVAGHVDIHMGTLSKAFACYGAYICASQTIIDYMINRARSLIFSTALPPSLAAAGCLAVERVAAADDRRSQLESNAEYFRNALKRKGMDIGSSTTQIVPLIVGTDADAVRVSKELRDRGLAAIAIRPPTVPENASRIRFSLMATHSRADLVMALDAVQQVRTTEYKGQPNET